MRQARALVPYALTALTVIGASAAALGLVVADVRDARSAAVDRAAATPAATPRAFPELSRAGRLAYWRTDPAGGAELMVSNLDGTLRRTLGRTEAIRRIALTRWTPDGDAVAYVDGGPTLVVARLDGTRSEIALGDEVRAQGGRIVDQRWSTDGARVAASVVRADLRSDVYLARAGDRTWTRATSLDDAFAGDWLDEDDVLVHSGGVLGTIRAGTTNGIRPLTGLPSASPLLADDGRIHFLTGAAVASTPRDITVPFLTASGASVWSMAVDGSDMRRETSLRVDDMRLDARYGPGRYLAHRGSSQLLALLSDFGVGIPPIDAGPVERAIVAPDGRSAVGFSTSRIIRFDLVRGAAPGAFGTPTVMLDSVAGGDVWHPRTVAPSAPGAPPAGERPAARYAFNLGGHLWTMEPDGTAMLLRPRASLSGRRASAPSWSSRGDRVLTLQLAGPGLTGITAATPIAVTIDRDGGVTPYPESRAATSTPSWSPDGEAFAVVVDRRGVDGTSGQAELEVRFLGVDGTIVRAAVRGRDAAWTRAGIVLLTDTGLELLDGAGARRTLVDAARILADPRGEFPDDRTSATFTSLAAATGGGYASVRVAVTPRAGANRFSIALVRVADGTVVAFLPGTGTQDLGWSPARPLLGLTLAGQSGSSAQVRDVAADRVVASQPGRFAGWSPDGAWFYVARDEGLFAFRSSGAGEGVRVGAIGVPVSATAP